ncbi:hypothetical protein RDI58_007123 [Solanum bulbocastanum]|uniref:Uncharacterized protein n=1 Tax=Solanum bulbocastanum TaxID=147425 RepID=A0AAN8TTG1_SOLBU
MLIDIEKELILEVEKWSSIEEQVLSQKSRAIWIEGGDSNAKYLHAQWKNIFSHNVVTSVYTGCNTKLTKPPSVEKEFIKVFSILTRDSATE